MEQKCRFHTQKKCDCKVIYNKCEPLTKRGVDKGMSKKKNVENLQNRKKWKIAKHT